MVCVQLCCTLSFLTHGLFHVNQQNESHKIYKSCDTKVSNVLYRYRYLNCVILFAVGIMSLYRMAFDVNARLYAVRSFLFLRLKSCFGVLISMLHLWTFVSSVSTFRHRWHHDCYCRCVNSVYVLLRSYRVTVGIIFHKSHCLIVICV